MASDGKSNSGKKPSDKDTREKARLAAEAARAAEKRRERMVMIVAGVAILVVVVGIVGGSLWWASRQTSSIAQSLTPRPDAPIPKGVDAATLAVPFPGNKGGNLPRTELWEDFQCPACKALEEANGKAVQQLALDGKTNLFWRPTAFLDRNIPQSSNSSQRAINAWGCAIDEGKTVEFHDQVFANQPQEGEGYSQDRLKQFGRDAGLDGQSFNAFSACVDQGRYIGWANNSLELFDKGNIGGTPTTLVNGVTIQWPFSQPGGVSVLEKAIADTAAGRTPTPEPTDSPVAQPPTSAPSDSASGQPPTSTPSG